MLTEHVLKLKKHPKNRFSFFPLYGQFKGGQPDFSADLLYYSLTPEVIYFNVAF